MGKLYSTKINKLEDGDYNDGNNLYLRVSRNSASKQWVLIYTSPISRKRRKMGLGSYPALDITKARELALLNKKLIASGLDPIDERLKETREAEKKRITFNEAATTYLEMRSLELKAITIRGDRSRLRTYISPIVGGIFMNQLTQEDILLVLRPIWESKRGNLGEKVQGFLYRVIRYSISQGWYDGSNVASWSERLCFVLPSPSKISPAKHLHALPVKLVPALMAHLYKEDSVGAMAAMFIILTALRSREGRHLELSEIDLKARKISIPAWRMKTQTPHQVPLSDATIDIIKKARKFSSGRLLFAGKISKRQVSDFMVMDAIKRAAKAIGYPDHQKVTVHGFRSCFSTWANEETMHQHEAIEHALSHVVGTAVSRAYSRKQMEFKRKPLMDDWAEFCMSKIDE